MSFNWQTEETGWDDLPPVAEPQVKARRRRWPWVAGLILALFIAAALLLYRQLNQRVAVAMEQAEADLLASHEIVDNAARTGDRELFTSFVSGRDPQWAVAQERAIREGAFFDRRTFGLTWLPGAGPTAVETTLSPDLHTAEVASEQIYAIDIGSGLTQTVTLRHTAVYRIGPNRWLFAPPQPEFWGETKRSQGRMLALTYPERDETIARRLALDIDAKLMEMCAALAGLECPPDLRIDVEFITEANSLNEATLAHSLAGAGETLQLPAPTLVGAPLDEAAYQALYRGYAAQVAAAAITDLVEWPCCNHALFYQALLVHQWRRLALWPWPLTGDDYETLTQLSLEGLRNSWSGTDVLEQVGDAKPHLALTEFLIQESGASVTAMQRALARSTATSAEAYWDWLFQFAGAAGSSREALEREWFRFAYARSTTAQTPPPAPLPAQDLQLLCRPVSGRTLALYRYDLAAQSLAFATNLDHTTAFMVGLPDDAGVAVGERLGTNANARQSMFLWEDGVKTIISWEGSGTPVALPSMTDPSGNFLLLDSVNESTVGLLNLAGCRQGSSCDLTVPSGFPVWSPDGERAILINVGTGQGSVRRAVGTLFLSEGDGENEQFLGSGATPFWLDDETFGFVTLDRVSLEQGIYIATVDEATAEPELILSAAELAAALPESQQPDSLHLDYVAATPTDPDLLLIATADPLVQAGRSYLFAFSRETGEVSMRLEIEGETRQYQRGYRFSPDGRWLLISSLNNADPVWFLYLYNIETGNTMTFTVNDTYRLPLHWYIDWPADGQWLSLPERGFVRLIAPDHNYERLLIPEDRVCTAAAWVNKD